MDVIIKIACMLVSVFLLGKIATSDWKPDTKIISACALCMLTIRMFTVITIIK